VAGVLLCDGLDDGLLRGRHLPAPPLFALAAEVGASEARPGNELLDPVAPVHDNGEAEPQ